MSYKNMVPETQIREILDALPERTSIRGYDETRQIYINGDLLLPVESQKVKNHSPGGFSWGYSGSGPAQLALAILLKYLPTEVAYNLHQDFNDNVVAVWPESDFKLIVNLKEEVEKILTKE